MPWGTRHLTGCRVPPGALLTHLSCVSLQPGRTGRVGFPHLLEDASPGQGGLDTDTGTQDTACTAGEETGPGAGGQEAGVRGGPEPGDLVTRGCLVLGPSNLCWRAGWALPLGCPLP